MSSFIDNSQRRAMFQQKDKLLFMNVVDVYLHFEESCIHYFLDSCGLFIADKGVKNIFFLKNYNQNGFLVLIHTYT